MIRNVTLPPRAILKSFFQRLALPLTSLDAEVIPTIGPLPGDSAASWMNAPSASPSGVHAPPMRTSVPERSTAVSAPVAGNAPSPLRPEDGMGVIESFGIEVPTLM